MSPRSDHCADMSSHWDCRLSPNIYARYATKIVMFVHNILAGRWHADYNIIKGNGHYRESRLSEETQMRDRTHRAFVEVIRALSLPTICHDALLWSPDGDPVPPGPGRAGGGAPFGGIELFPAGTFGTDRPCAGAAWYRAAGGRSLSFTASGLRSLALSPLFFLSIRFAQEVTS